MNLRIWNNSINIETIIYNPRNLNFSFKEITYIKNETITCILRFLHFMAKKLIIFFKSHFYFYFALVLLSFVVNRQNDA
jgi:hypothetical protein